LILVDALRADHLGCYAGEDLGTPNIDRLARQGVVFENAISQGSWTRPSTASMMTGLYPSQNGVGSRWSKTDEGRLSARSLDPSIPTLAETLTARGHTTAFMGGNAILKPLFGVTRGFTHNLWRSIGNDGAVIVEDFERWTQTEPPESSFCYMHFMDVHKPLPTETIPARLDTGLDLDLVQESKNELMGYYAAAVRRVDQHIGGVIRTLESAGMLEDTLIIISADHGEELGEHGGMLSHGRTLYRELLHVPLVVRLPGEAFAGERIGHPVQLIDFMPTILDYLQCPPMDVPGWSLLALIRGEETERAAFSEHVKPDRYSQSVTTRTHQLIKSYQLENTRPGSPADLQPGISVAAKGQRIQGGRFIPTKILMQREDRPTLSGTIERVDAASSSVTLMGITCQIDEDTKFISKEDRGPLTLDGLAVGDRVTLNFDAGSNGRHVATTVKRKAPGGKSKIEGRIEQVQDLEGGLRSITVLGTDILIDSNTKVQAIKDVNREDMKVSPVSRVLTGDFIDVHTELYDVTSDPAETRNIVDERPDIAQELEEMLALWTQSLLGQVRETTGSVDVDPETMEQLRLMGYVE
jgi:arylsulfatase A-like enzyme